MILIILGSDPEHHDEELSKYTLNRSIRKTMCSYFLSLLFRDTFLEYLSNAMRYQVVATIIIQNLIG